MRIALTTNELARLREALEYAVARLDEEERGRFGEFRSCQFAAWRDILARWDQLFEPTATSVVRRDSPLQTNLPR
jgi:hypothetical protein